MSREKTEHLTPNEPAARDYRTDLERAEYDDNHLEKIRTAQSTMTITPEMFERLYLNPKMNTSPALRKTFANPTPLAVVGFVMSLTPLSCVLMGFRGATSPVAGLGGYYYLGGLCMMLGGFLEFFLGNTFPFVVFVSFGGFWLSFATTLNGTYGIQAAYSATGDAAAGAASKGYNTAFAFYLVFWAVLCFIYLIISLRTNLVFAMIFFTVDMDFILLSAAYFDLGAGNVARAGKMIVAGGAFAFVCSMCGWYLLIVILLDSLDFPISLPVGDLSNLIKPKTKLSTD